MQLLCKIDFAEEAEGLGLLTLLPLCRCLCAGEATHTSINPCMQAALETGQRAATQVLAALNAPSSRL
jgi:hypothetical protein